MEVIQQNSISHEEEHQHPKCARSKKIPPRIVVNLPNDHNKLPVNNCSYPKLNLNPDSITKMNDDTIPENVFFNNEKFISDVPKFPEESKKEVNSNVNLNSFLTPQRPKFRHHSTVNSVGGESLSLLSLRRFTARPSEEEKDENLNSARFEAKEKMRSRIKTSLKIQRVRSGSTILKPFEVFDSDQMTSAMNSRIEEADLQDFIDDKNIFDETYEELEILGDGSTGLVKKCKHKSSGKYYAVKIVRTNDPEDLRCVKNEFELISKYLNHKNIVRVYELFYDPIKSKLRLIMELVDGTEIFQHICKTGRFSESYACFLFSQVLEGIDHMHSNGVCHRDLQPHNIMITNDVIKITDFNVSKLCKKTSQTDKYIYSMYTETGMLAFTAPETINSTGYDEKVDLWSAGAVLFTMLAGYQPFESENKPELISQITEGRYDLEKEPWPSVSDDCKDLIQKLLMVEPEKRYTCQEAMQHSWLKKRNEYSKEKEQKEFEDSLAENLENLKKIRKFTNSHLKHRRLTRFGFSIKGALESNSSSPVKENKDSPLSPSKKISNFANEFHFEPEKSEQE